MGHEQSIGQHTGFENIHTLNTFYLNCMIAWWYEYLDRLKSKKQLPNSIRQNPLNEYIVWFQSSFLGIKFDNYGPHRFTFTTLALQMIPLRKKSPDHFLRCSACLAFKWKRSVCMQCFHNLSTEMELGCSTTQDA